MNFEEKIEEVLVERLKQACPDAVVKTAESLEEKRDSPFVVVVKHDETAQANPGLPDWFLDYTIVVDCWIEPDRDAKMFFKVKDGVEKVVSELAYRGRDLSQDFGDIGVVGFFSTGFRKGMSVTSNTLAATLKIVVSEHDTNSI